MTGFLQDVRHAMRGLSKSRAFTLTAILTLGICIGANVALFAVAHRVLLRPLPVPDSDRIILIYNSYPKAGAERVRCHSAGTTLTAASTWTSSRITRSSPHVIPASRSTARRNVFTPCT